MIVGTSPAAGQEHQLYSRLGQPGPDVAVLCVERLLMFPAGPPTRSCSVTAQGLSTGGSGCSSGGVAASLTACPDWSYSHLHGIRFLEMPSVVPQCITMPACHAHSSRVTAAMLTHSACYR